MGRNPHLDFFEKELPQHVSCALGNRLASRRDKKPKLAEKDQEESPAHEAAEAPEAEQQEDSGIPGASQEDDSHSAVPSPRRVYMMPSEKLERKALQKRQPALKPRVIR